MPTAPNVILSRVLDRLIRKAEHANTFLNPERAQAFADALDVISEETQRYLAGPEEDDRESLLGDIVRGLVVAAYNAHLDGYRTRALDRMRLS